MGKDTSFFRKIPAVQTLLEDPASTPLLQAHGHDEVVAALRRALDELRGEASRGRCEPPDRADLLTRTALLLLPPARRLINATGVLLHTHLGRAPLPAESEPLLTGYMNLEISLADGERGNRNALAGEMLARLTGAPAAMVVNNNAAAVLLMLTAFASGREVLISRGELVEIGGSFRIPDILEQSGCVLREVGTTNRTTLDDYRRAITERTAGILKVHPSNFRIRGFVSQVPARELAAAARERGLPLWVDQGCGLIRPIPGFDLGDEEPVADLVEAGAEVVTFSGDKLLGGPQAGLLAGSREAVERMLGHPLYRALRPGKETYIWLQAVLRHHLARRWEAIPLWGLAMAPVEGLKKRALAVRKRLPELDLHLEDARSRFGGGTTPLFEFPSVALRWKTENPQARFARLLARPKPVLGYIQGDALHFDLRTVFPDEDPALTEALREVAAT